MVVLVRGAEAWLGQVHEEMEGEILQIVSMKTSSKVIRHKVAEKWRFSWSEKKV